MLKKDEKSDTSLYMIGWCMLAALFLLWAFMAVTGINLTGIFGVCVFHKMTGLYCPGCGGTRALRALLAGELVKSFFYHPFVVYAAVFGGWFMISQTIERVLRGRIQIAMHAREIYLWAALAIIFMNFVIKNLALLVWQVDFMPV